MLVRRLDFGAHLAKGLQMGGSVNSVDTVFSAATPTVAPKLSAVSTPPSSSSTPLVASTSVLVQNPRVVFDPSAGFITEYLSSNGGQVVSQTPSAITVAYMRQGLDPDGTPKLTGSVGTTA